MIALLAAVGILGAVAAASPQGPATCTVQLDSVGGVARQVQVAPGTVHTFAGGGVWASCRGRPTAVQADSAAWYSDRDRVDFIGRVRFRDSAMTLEARTASYYVRLERLDAAGDVRLVNLETGSDLAGPVLTYWRAAPGVRDTADLVASGRPTVHYRQASDPAENPYTIVGERVRLRGSDQAWAGGTVSVVRGDFEAEADSAALDAGGGRGLLVGHAEVRGRGATPYSLTGRLIRFRLADHRLTWVQAEGAAEAMSSAWRLTADTIAFDLVNDQIADGTAWGDSLRPHARSDRYTMRADSLVLETPGQQLREIRGYGSALATAARDSLDGQPDWVAGDSLAAVFDTAGSGKPQLRTLDARGRAKAYYRVYHEDGAALAGINYSRGRRILVAFSERGVDRVRVLGEGDGVYLEPIPKKP